MMTAMIVYVGMAFITFLLLAALEGRFSRSTEPDSVGVMVFAVAWPLSLLALVAVLFLIVVFHGFDLLYFTVSAWFRGQK